jgi:uncharacterized phage protein gp47/JayE
MPWFTPTLRQVREMVRDDITTALTGAAVVGNTVLRVMADAQAGLARLILKYLDWLSRQLLPDTAETLWLDRHGTIWLVNADGSLGRKSPLPASGTVGFSGTEGVLIPEGFGLTAPSGDTYETLEFLTLPAPGLQPAEVAVKALNPGGSGNQPAGTLLAPTVPQSGVSGDVTVIDLRGGLDTETDDQLRARVLARIRQPPMGGDADDYWQWTMAIPTVTRCFVAARELGMGTVTVRFMVDALRADTGGFPTMDDINVVYGYLDQKRPVAIRDFYVVSPVPEPITFHLSLGQDSMIMRQQVQDSVAAMIRERAQCAHTVNGELLPGTTILASWVAEAINRVTQDFDLTMDDHPMPHNGALAVLGTINYPVP